MAITHGFGGFAQVGTTRVLCRPGASFAMPRNLDVPYPISYQNFGNVNYADGLRYPVINLPAIPMDQTTPWFTAALLNAWFVTRGSMPNPDLSAISSGLLFSDNGVVTGAGLGTFRVLNPKGAGYSLNVESAQPIGFQLRFAGTDRSDTASGGGALSAPANGLAGTPLQFNAVSFGGDLASKGIVGVSLNWDTALTPNPVLNGTLRPTEMNAGMPTASLTIRMVADPSVSPPGWNADPTLYTAISGTISIQRATGVGNTVVWTINNGILINPDDRRQGVGRIIREYTYNLLGTTTALPVTIADV